MKLSPTTPDLRTIINRVTDGDIDLQPNFQRQEVWSRTKKRKLIDTILRKWSVPPIHLVETVDGKMEVLDGQQRLAAIRDFFLNKFSIDGKALPFDPEIEALDNKYFKDLNETTRRRLERFSITCFELTDYSPEEPSELFYRLNQPTLLTSGEQRNSLFGPARDQLKDLTMRMDDLKLNVSTLGFSNVRLAYDDVIARLLVFIEREDFALKSTERLISDRFRENVSFSYDVVVKCERAIEGFSEAVHLTSKYRFNKASFFSWLLFFSRRSPDQVKQLKFLGDFVMPSARASDLELALHDIFEDRSRLRVTDISSVVLRDFSLWMSYFLMHPSELPASIPRASIESCLSAVENLDRLEAASVIEESVEYEIWGRTL